MNRSYLTGSDMDHLCIGLGVGCVHCNNLLPGEDDPRRVCQAITNRKRTHGIARKLHDRR